MTRFTSFIFCCICILLSSASATNPPNTNIDAWLTTASLSLPPITLTTKLLGTNLDIHLKGFLCNNLSIDSIQAKAVRKNKLPGTTLSIANLAIHSCKGDYSASYGKIKLASGSFLFGVDTTNITLAILYDEQSTIKPLVFPTSMCIVSLNLNHLHFQGTLASILNGLSSTIEGLLHNAVASKICGQLQTIVAPIANQIFAPLILPPVPPPSSPVILPSTSRRLIKWKQDVPLFQGLVKKEEDSIRNKSTKAASTINSLVSLLTNNTGRITVPPVSFLSNSISIPLNISGIQATATAGITSLTLDGLNHIQSLGVNASQEVLAMYINAAPSSVKEPPLGLSVSFWLSTLFTSNSLLYAPTPLNISATIKSDVFDVHSSINVLIAGDYEAMNVLNMDGLKDIADASSIRNALGTVAKGILDMNVTSSNVQAVLNEISIKQTENGRLANQLTESLSTFFASVLNVKRFRQNLLPNIYSSMEPTSRHSLNVKIAALLNNVTALAPENKDGSFQEPRPNIKIIESHVMNKVFIMLTTMIVISLSFIVMLPVLEKQCCFVSKVQKVFDLETPLITPGSEKDTLTSVTTLNNSNSNSDQGNSYKSSLAAEYNGTWIRLGLPILHILCATIGAWSLMVPVADVRVRLTGGLVNASMVVLDDSLLLYTFPQMVSDFWNSGSWMIAVLLVGGTAILPQAKGALSLLVWSIPLQHHHRGYILMALDIIGRFVLVCQIFIMLVIATLRTSIDGIPGLKTDVVAEPIHSIAGATVGILSMMVVSQWTLFLHDAVAPQRKKAYNQDISTIKFSTVQKIAMTLVLLFLAVTVCIGLTTELLEFQIDGIAGSLLKYTDISSTSDVKHISLMSLPQLVYEDTDEKWIAVFVGCTIWLFAVVAPVLTVICWFVQWFWFMCNGSSSPHDAFTPLLVRYSALITTYSYAWCAFDVLFASIGAASLEMDLVTQWIVTGQPGIGPLCSNITATGGVPCVKVTGRLMSGGWWMLGAAMMMLLVFGITSKTFGLRSR